MRVRIHKRNKTLETVMIGADLEGKGGKQAERCGGWVERGVYLALQGVLLLAGVELGIEQKV